MKILITTDWYKPVINGVVTSVMNLAEGLKERGHEVRILTLSRSVHSYKDGDVIYLGSVNAGCVYPKARLRIPVSNKLVGELTEWKADVIHSQCEFSTFAISKKLADLWNVPVVHTYHTIYEDYTHYFSPRKTWGRHLVQVFTRRIASQISAMIAPTDKIYRILSGYEVGCEVNVIPSGIDLNKYKKPMDDAVRNRLRAQIGIPEGKTGLIYIGRLAKEKNIDELLRMQKEVQKLGTVLVLVGDGPYRQNLEKEVQRLEISDSVIFTGMVSPKKVGEYYRAGDLFVSASTSETQGMTYIEALACGTPLLCRRDECLERVVREGENGWQYDSEEEFQELIRRFQGLDRKKREEMSLAASESAERFSLQCFARAVEEIYKREILKYTTGEWFYAA